MLRDEYIKIAIKAWEIVKEKVHKDELITKEEALDTALGVIGQMGHDEFTEMIEVLMAREFTGDILCIECNKEMPETRKMYCYCKECIAEVGYTGDPTLDDRY